MHDVWRDGNRFELLAEASCFLPVMSAAIKEARHSILIELYLMQSGRLATALIDALCRAAGRGVTVALMLDAYGAMGLGSEDRRRLEEAGVALRLFNPLGLRSLTRNLTRDHRKLMVIDGRIAFTGGFGVVDEFLDAWYEVAVCIEGPVVADWVWLFSRLWDSPLTRGTGAAALVRHLRLERNPQENGRGMRGRVVWGQGYRYQAIRHSLYGRVSSAQRRIWLCTPYFVPTFSLRMRLARAARRGVDVRLLLPGHDHDHPWVRYAGQRFYRRLLRAGVRIFEFQPAFIHAKFSLVDQWSSLGSCNFDHWSLHWNLEANQEVDDVRFANEVAALFERNFAASREITHQAWVQRPRWQRFKEWLFGSFDAWLTRLR
ncbi:phosphatidylserine/phosphatidylglycerophosphate/cardiolipin synthase family protein [Halomonas sp. MCCC 1A11036]|uniref:Phosphatidylserine/phosphatidylglycerophosphate/ cardiolipin synthase family protein n=1 Tax=Billgrantia zhangzhouensis TaxID=2733481 RepID=A0ABS9AF17_9GAMM|nr:phospholipase D-like domain-containing protein [Halomonas zhangzhouensis]MCE8020314.1 phosphatidylserine/phosphatidylglycerophosphate/cardiolipin synthase family protein [Halomonas zhangzhouensis]